MEIVRIHINLGPNQEPELIVILKGQEHMSEYFAHQLCMKHGYNSHIENKLAKQIQNNIDRAIGKLNEN